MSADGEEETLDRRADAAPIEVAEADLLAAPTRYHGRTVIVTGAWTYGLECSSFAGAWLEVVGSARYASGLYRVRVVGRWSYPDNDGRYGHLGALPGELRAETLEVLEHVPQDELRDGLTGLLTKRQAVRAWESMKRDAGRVVLALLDIERLGDLNAAHGHAVGDEVLRRFAAATVDAVGERDVVVRWAGDELAVLFRTGPDEARASVDRAIDAIRSLAIPVPSGALRIAVSYGMVASGPGESLLEAAARAEVARTTLTR